MEALQSRLKSYYELTLPILDHYKSKRSIVAPLDSNDNNDASASERQIVDLLCYHNLIPQAPSMSNYPASLDNSVW